MLIAWKSFTATLSGQSLKSVKCEMCGAEYHYELVRTGVGYGTALYYVGQTWAANRAQAAAQKSLAKRLEKDAEMVPCPKCFWVNQELVNTYRKSRYRSLSTAIMVVFILTCTVGPIVRYFMMGGRNAGTNKPDVAMFYVLGVGFALSAFLFIVRLFLRQRIDPNSTYPRQPSVPMGTPPALVKQIDPQTQTVCLAPTPSGADQNTESNSIVFRTGQLTLPDICCVCLAPSTTIYSIPIKVNENSGLEVPVCHSCCSSLKRKWWLTMLGILAGSYLLAGIVAFCIPQIKPDARWAIIIVAGFVIAVIAGVLIGSLSCRSMRLDVVDASRNIYKIYAHNPHYIAKLAEIVRASEGREASK